MDLWTLCTRAAGPVIGLVMHDPHLGMAIIPLEIRRILGRAIRDRSVEFEHTENTSLEHAEIRLKGGQKITPNLHARQQSLLRKNIT